MLLEIMRARRLTYPNRRGLGRIQKSTPLKNISGSYGVMAWTLAYHNKPDPRNVERSLATKSIGKPAQVRDGQKLTMQNQVFSEYVKSLPRYVGECSNLTDILT